jgi:hypothetical protein
MEKRILILAANPRDSSRLRLDQEIRDIDNGLQRASKRDDLVLKQQLAARPVDVRRAMLDFRPNIVHFCGHGAEEGVAFEDETGLTKLVSAEALSRFFELFADKIDCVLLNACYTEAQAEAIAQHIAYVIGMKGGIGDTAAIEFAVAFYDALGAGESIEFAHKLACNAIEWTGLPEHLTPVLKRGPKAFAAQQPGQVCQNADKEAYRAFVWSKGIFDFTMVVTYHEQDLVRDVLKVILDRNSGLYNYLADLESKGWFGLVNIYMENENGRCRQLYFDDPIPKSSDDFDFSKRVSFSISKKERPEPRRPCDIRLYLSIGCPGT